MRSRPIRRVAVPSPSLTGPITLKRTLRSTRQAKTCLVKPTDPNLSIRCPRSRQVRSLDYPTSLMPLFGLLLVLKTAAILSDVKNAILRCPDRHEGSQQLPVLNRTHPCAVGAAQIRRIFS